MELTDSRYNVLVARVKKLEVRTRIWQIVALVVLFALGFARTENVKAQQIGQLEQVRATTVEAQDFLLKDAAGRVLGQLSVRDGKPQLELYDASGKVTWSTSTRLMAAGQ
jgi:hypothetical protein